MLPFRVEFGIQPVHLRCLRWKGGKNRKQSCFMAACFASGGPISCPVKKWGKETAGGRFRFLPPDPYLKRRKGRVPLRIPPAQSISTFCHRITLFAQFSSIRLFSMGMPYRSATAVTKGSVRSLIGTAIRFGLEKIYPNGSIAWHRISAFSRPLTNT